MAQEPASGPPRRTGYPVRGSLHHRAPSRMVGSRVEMRWWRKASLALPGATGEIGRRQWSGAGEVKGMSRTYEAEGVLEGDRMIRLKDPLPCKEGPMKVIVTPQDETVPHG